MMELKIYICKVGTNNTIDGKIGDVQKYDYVYAMIRATPFAYGGQIIWRRNHTISNFDFF